MAGIFRSLLAEQDRLIRVFAISRIAHPVLIDMFGIAGGYDGLWLDQEHAGLTTEQMTMACITGRSRGLGCFVRLATPHYSLVNQALESGADARVEIWQYVDRGSGEGFRDQNIDPSIAVGQ